MKTIKIIIIFLIAGNFATAQTDSVSVKKEISYGPDKTHFVHAYFNFMFAVPPSEGTDADIFYGKSHTFSYGVRYKLKIANFFAVGAGLNYTYKVWHFKQNEDKKIPTSNIYDKEKLKINILGADIFIRFNFGKNKKSPVGNYVDIGAYGDWDFSDSRQYKNFINSSDTDGYSTFTGSEKDLNYLEKINYGAEFRAGYGRVVLFSKYRMSDMFTQDYKNTVSADELPRLMIGFEIGFHK